jgi:hypothetical protein
MLLACRWACVLHLFYLVSRTFARKTDAAREAHGLQRLRVCYTNFEMSLRRESASGGHTNYDQSDPRCRDQG